LDKIDALTNEIAINLHDSNENDYREVKYLLEEMEKLVKSIEKYK
jgi:hypothetical protein